jgi:hypothetical protein
MARILTASRLEHGPGPMIYTLIRHLVDNQSFDVLVSPQGMKRDAVYP